MTQKQQPILKAVKIGKYPRGICIDSDGNSTLHVAALNRRLPTWATVADFANCKNNKGITALHIAAHRGCLPVGTTAADLLNCKDNYGISALHEAAYTGHLPTDTTVADLTNCQTNKGATAWDNIIHSFNNVPSRALNTLPTLFKDHHHLAVQWVTKAVEKDPTLKARATLWLSKVLAATDQNGCPAP